MVKQGWRSGESTCLPPVRPRVDIQIQRHTWVEIVGSLPCSERFFPPDTLVFLSPQKPTFDLICSDSSCLAK